MFGKIKEDFSSHKVITSAEGEGFEPPNALTRCWFSRPVQSARLCHPSDKLFIKTYMQNLKRIFKKLSKKFFYFINDIFSVLTKPFEESW